MAVAEAALFEPVLHGSMTSVDEMLTRFNDALIEANPDPETWGTGAASQAALAMLGEPAVMPEPEPGPGADEKEELGN